MTGVTHFVLAVVALSTPLVGAIWLMSTHPVAGEVTESLLLMSALIMLFSSQETH